MSYLSSPNVGGRAPRTLRTPMGSSSVMLCTGFGDTTNPQAAAANLATKVKALQQQINRYTMAGGAPVQLRAAAAPVVVTGTLDQDTAERAIWVMTQRAWQTSLEWADRDSQLLLKEANTAWGNARGFVEQNIDRVTSVVKLFADKHGIPAAKGGIIGMTPTVIVGALTVGALAFIFTRGRR